MTTHLGHAKHAADGKNTGISRNGKSKRQCAVTVTCYADLSSPISSPTPPADIPVNPHPGNKVRIIGYQQQGARIVGRYLKQLARNMTPMRLSGSSSNSSLGSFGPAPSADQSCYGGADCLAEPSAEHGLPHRVSGSRASGTVQNKAVYLALGINTEGQKELLGPWKYSTY